MKKIILTDCDGVVLDWGSTFEQYVRYHLKIDFETPPDQYYKVEELLNLSHKETNELILKFHASEYFKHLSSFRDSVKYIRKLSAEGWDFVAITAAGQDSEKIKKNRTHNLKTHFGNAFKDIIIVDLDSTKLDTLKQFKPTFWVDDSPRQVFAGIEAGHTSFFMYRPHKAEEVLRNPNKVNTVYNWKEIYNYINNSFKGEK